MNAINFTEENALALKQTSKKKNPFFWYSFFIIYLHICIHNLDGQSF